MYRRPTKVQDRAAIILAGGDGTRLSSFTESLAGRPIPKQFCPVFGNETMLDRTLRRVSALNEEFPTFTVVPARIGNFTKASSAITRRRNFWCNLKTEESRRRYSMRFCDWRKCRRLAL